MLIGKKEVPLRCSRQAQCFLPSHYCSSYIEVSCRETEICHFSCFLSPGSIIAGASSPHPSGFPRVGWMELGCCVHQHLPHHLPHHLLLGPLLGDSTAMNRGLSEAGGGTQPSCPCPRSPPLRVEFAGVV